MTTAERMQRLRIRRRIAGLVRKEIWIHPDDWDRVRARVDELAKEREAQVVERRTTDDH